MPPQSNTLKKNIIKINLNASIYRPENKDEMENFNKFHAIHKEFQQCFNVVLWIHGALLFSG